MKIHVPKFLKSLPAGRHGKRNIWTIVIVAVLLIVGAFIIFGRGEDVSKIQTGFAERQNLEETVLVTGQVFSGTDLSLSFQTSGVVYNVYVKEGDAVKKGQLLASLNQSSALATLTTAQGSLAQAEANYNKLIAGADISTGVTVIKSREIALTGANNDALNALDDARLKSYNVLSAVTTLQNTYFTDFSGAARNGKIQIKDSLDLLEASFNKAKISRLQPDIDDAISTTIDSLNTISGALKVIRDTLDELFYYGRVPESEKTAIDTQRANINSAITSVISSQQAISNAKISLLQSQPEIELARAQILSAQGQVDSARAALNNSVIIAPTSGTITKVSVKVGEQATQAKEVMVLQDINDLHTEADVSEANIASLQIGQAIDYTFDALGPNDHFEGKVTNIDPASTVVSGVVNYKIKGSLENVPSVKPGMTANMTIMVAKKENVLSVPSTAVISKNNKYYVRVIDNSKNKTYHEVEVKTGLKADGGLVEIISGVSDGQEIVTYIKK